MAAGSYRRGLESLRGTGPRTTGNGAVLYGQRRGSLLVRARLKIKAIDSGLHGNTSFEPELQGQI